jgi:5-hydroxyisourate hydrolase
MANPHIFARLTRRAKQAVHFAHEEAHLLRQPAVNDEHLLLGLIREGVGVAARVLEDAGVQLDAVRTATLNSLGEGSSNQNPNQQLSLSAHNVIVQAVHEAEALDHTYVGTEHLLLALLNAPNNHTVMICQQMGIDTSKIRNQVLEVAVSNQLEPPHTTLLERTLGSLQAPSQDADSANNVGDTHTPMKKLQTGRLTTHVLDTSQGRPASHIRIELWWLGANGKQRTLLKATTSNADGRTDEPLLEGEMLQKGIYELVFAVGSYFIEQGFISAHPPFLDEVPIRFGVADSDKHYHVPLLVSPWSYNTYRGS